MIQSAHCFLCYFTIFTYYNQSVCIAVETSVFHFIETINFSSWNKKAFRFIFFYIQSPIQTVNMHLYAWYNIVALRLLHVCWALWWRLQYSSWNVSVTLYWNNQWLELKQAFWDSIQMSPPNVSLCHYISNQDMT